MSGDAGWRLRLVALFMTLLGLLFVASLIGLIGAATARGEIALGYRKGVGPAATVVVNPDKTIPVDLADDDSVIVIANT